MVSRHFKNHVDNYLEENVNNAYQLLDMSGSKEMNYFHGGMFINQNGQVKSDAYTHKSTRDVLKENLMLVSSKNTTDYRYLTNNEYVAYRFGVLTNRISDRGM